MKNYILLLFLTTLICGCANKASKVGSTSSTTKTASNEDFSNLKPDVLLKQAKAHFDLDQFKKSQQKINVLMQEHPGSEEAIAAEALVPLLDEKLKEVRIAAKQRTQDSIMSERQKRLPSAVEKMRRIPTSGGRHMYVDMSSPEFETKECFYAYIIRGPQTQQLFFRIRYVASSWLDMENIVVTVDQKDFNLKDAVRKEETNGKKKLKIEIMDIPIDTQEEFEIVRAIAEGTSVTAAYVGSSAYKKRDVTQRQITAVQNVLDTYEFFGGSEFEM